MSFNLDSLDPAHREKIAQRFFKIGRKVETSPHVFLLIGAPATGKSTWTTRHLLDNPRPTTIISSDNQIEAYAAKNGLTYSQAHDKLDMKALEGQMRSDIRVASGLKHDIIIDRTNMRLKSRNRWLSQLPGHYLRIGVLFIVEPVEVLLARVKTRAAATGKHVPTAVVKDMLENYQPPTLAEFDVILTPETN